MNTLSNYQEIFNQVQVLAKELVELANTTPNSVFVLGCSTSEIIGENIGKSSKDELGTIVVQSLLDITSDYNLFLAVQGCEHINRSLVVEKEYAIRNNLEIVNVVPVLTAGGPCATAAYKLFKDPVVVEHISAALGMDIGDTAIGMHIKHVQIPRRLSSNKIGQAHTTFLTSRPKLIGGDRAVHK